MNISISHDQGAYIYLLFCLAAIVVIVTGAGLAARKSSFNYRELAFVVCICILTAIMGSKLSLLDGSQWMMLLTEGHLPIQDSKSMTGVILGVMFGAWASGKIIGKGESILDLCAVSFPLGMAVQRIGCLFVGCCHGVMTSMPWGITYGPGSKPYLEQMQLGIISADASSSLAVHPDQLYCSIACVAIAIMTWSSGARLKSPMGKFLLSIILYMSFRFVEEFFRFRLQPEEWMGLQTEQWKLLSIATVLSFLLLFRERKYIHAEIFNRENSLSLSTHNVRITFFSILILGISVYIGTWLTADERIILLLSVFPLCVLLNLDLFLRSTLSRKYVRTSALLCFALVLMSQKADAPGDTPESYTTFNINSAIGKFNSEHDFNHRREFVPGCGPGEPGQWVELSDKITYRHSYQIGGLGIGRKVYYNQWQSLLASFNVFIGKEKETPVNFTGLTYTPPVFNNTLWSINPMVQYDTRGIGLGLGGSFGMLGHDIDDKSSDTLDYNPKSDARHFSLQTRLRLFSERHSFIEVLGGYDVGSVGDYNWQLLYGTRFNSEKYMLRAGFGWSKYGGKSYVLRGQMQLTPKLFLSPEFMFGRKYYLSGGNEGRGSRVAVTLEYRLKDKKHKLTHK